MLEHVDILACPDCRHDLRQVVVDGSLKALICPTCSAAFPVIDDVCVLLGRSARSHGLEYGPIAAIRPHADASDLPAIEKTLALLEERRGATSWEWEDEEYWTREYGRQDDNTPVKNWNDRIWQRERLVERLLQPGELRGKTILDIGCGEGQNFRAVLAPYCDEETLYVAVDISLAGLKLNRRRNLHKKALYVLASANSVPLRDRSIDLLCYWGILHHTERRAATIAEDLRLLRDGGYVMLHEAMTRASFLPEFLKPRDEESAHEERIPESELRSVLSDARELQVVVWDEMHTAIFTGLVRFFGPVLVKSKRLFWLVTNADAGLIPRLGPLLPFLRAGSIMLGARVRRSSAPSSAS